MSLQVGPQVTVEQLELRGRRMAQSRFPAVGGSKWLLDVLFVSAGTPVSSYSKKKSV